MKVEIENSWRMEKVLFFLPTIMVAARKKWEFAFCFLFVAITFKR